MYMAHLSISVEMASDFDYTARSPEAEPLDALFDRAYDFVGTGQTFTARELHGYLLQFFPLSPEPDHFEEIVPKILECMSVYARLHGVTDRSWNRAGEGYDSALYSFVDEALVVAPVVTETVEFEHDAEVDLVDEATMPPRSVDSKTVRVVDPDDRVDKPMTFSEALIRRPRNHKFEAPPVRFDAPFSTDELSLARTALNRLSWNTARTHGVSITGLINYMQEPGVRPSQPQITAMRAILARMWVRGVVRRDVSDSNGSRLFLPVDFPPNDINDIHDTKELQERLKDLGSTLAVSHHLSRSASGRKASPKRTDWSL